MNARTLVVLALAAVLLAGLAIVAQNRAGSDSIAGAAAGSRLLPALEDEASAIVQIAIDGAGGARLVTLVRDGDAWTVTELDGYAADFAAVRALLVALAEARIVEEKTANPDFHSRLGVEDVSSPAATGLDVTLHTSGGDTQGVVLGDSDGSNGRYARRADDPQSYLIDRNPEIERDPADWVVPDIVDIETARVQRVEIRHGDGERVVIRKESPEDSNFSVDDMPEGRELQYASVANVTASAIRDLGLEAVARAGESPAEPSVEIEYRTFDGLVLTVTGAAADADQGEPWLTFRARFEPEPLAQEAAQESQSDSGDVPENAATVDTDGSATTVESMAGGAAVATEVDSINARVEGWRYRIPSYQYDQMTRRLEDLLQPSEPAETE